MWHIDTLDVTLKHVFKCIMGHVVKTWPSQVCC